MSTRPGREPPSKTALAECKFCRGEVRADALKCRHCGSWLRHRGKQVGTRPVPDLNDDQILLVLDRGLVYFGKFILGIVVFVLALATAYFGFDLNKAREDVEQMRKDVQAAQKEVMDTKTSVIAISASAQEQFKQAQEKSAQASATLAEILSSAQRESSQIHAIVLAAVPRGNSMAATSDKGTTGGMTVPQIASLYNFPKGLDGAGQTVAFIELGGGYRDSDLDAYFSELHLHRPKVSAVSVDGASNRPEGNASGADGAVMFDIEVVGAVAPAANLVAYFAPNSEKGFLDAIITASHDAHNSPSVIVITWGLPESSWSMPSLKAMDTALRAATLESGITVLAAAGDSGVTEGQSDGRRHVGFPASSPWVISVGGTYLVASGGKISSEVVWNNGDLGATGGGVSDIFARPDWQSGASVPSRKDGTFGRGIPDVAAAADLRSGYMVRVDGQNFVLGGTNGAAPLWGGLIVLLNQALGSRLGYLNARLYQQVAPAGVLRGITEGNNGRNGVPGYAAGPGWNAATGWGVPDGQRLLEWLRAHPPDHKS